MINNIQFVEDEFYSIWWSDGNNGYMVEVFDPSELNIGEELESDRGGLCTGSAKVLCLCSWESHYD